MRFVLFYHSLISDWIGNWGDGERGEEISRFLIDPAQALGLKARVHGVRYPPQALRTLESANIEYCGWLPNFEVPAAFAKAKTTLHIPRRYYARNLPGIPTIRMFEALACGIPLVPAPWSDCENLFRPGRDYLVARTGEEMREHLRRLCASPGERRHLARSGLETILARHTCAHRVAQLLEICQSLSPETQHIRRPACATAEVF